MSDEKCCTGCNIFYGGEIRHIRECFFYPESLTEIYDRKDEENAKLKEENARLRELVERAKPIVASCGFAVCIDDPESQWLKDAEEKSK